jgi:hypothetical protein
MDHAIEELALATIVRLVPEDQVEPLRAEVRRIARREPGSRYLASDFLTVAGIIVQVCAVAVNLYRLKKEHFQKKPEELAKETVKEAARVTGDPAVANDERVRAAATEAARELTKDGDVSRPASASGAAE